MAATDLRRLRYKATCSSCYTALPAGALARWDRAARTATCQRCVESETADTPPAPIEIDRGLAGASAAREWKRRHDAREAAIRARHKRLGGLLLALSADPQSTSSWATGALGEQTIGRSLDRLRESGIAVLHDRRIPGSRANIDHIVISQTGVWVIDTKHYKGRVEHRDVGGWFRTDIRLYVGGRDRTTLIDGIRRQATAVRQAMAAHPQWANVRITATLLFMSDDNWSLLDFRPLLFDDVYVLWGKALGKLIRAKPTGPGIDIAALERDLALALPPA